MENCAPLKMRIGTGALHQVEASWLRQDQAGITAQWEYVGLLCRALKCFSKPSVRQYDFGGRLPQ
ncbi:UNVERIFIED_CONTAM: hypothetical protein Sradi_0176000 [Sesamum radiatum]|uniref:Uncharacterized protein n=1 Tax=Sesamum radiatum TaxID=300843 RepID=A0AAW2W3D1_SESRA